MEELLFLNGILLCRLVYILNDGRLSNRTLIIFGLAQVALCLLVRNRTHRNSGCALACDCLDHSG